MRRRPYRSIPLSAGATAVEAIVMMVLVALLALGLIKIFGSGVSEKVASAEQGVATLGKDTETTGGEGQTAGGSSGGEATEQVENATQKIVAPETKLERQERASQLHPLVGIVILLLIGLLGVVMVLGNRNSES